MSQVEGAYAAQVGQGVSLSHIGHELLVEERLLVEAFQPFDIGQYGSIDVAIGQGLLERIGLQFGNTQVELGKLFPELGEEAR